jgi:hypothetical protein
LSQLKSEKATTQQRNKIRKVKVQVFISSEIVKKSKLSKDQQNGEESRNWN